MTCPRCNQTWQATKALDDREEARAMAEELADALVEVLTHGPRTQAWAAMDRYREWWEGLR